MKHQLTPTEEAEARKNRQKLLEVEAAGLALLFSARNRAIAAGLSSQRSNAWIAHLLEEDLTFAIREARRRSRLAGISRLRAEAAALGFELGQAHDTLVKLATHDVKRAADAAKSYARRFRKVADDSGPEFAKEATRGSVTRIGATESSDAFNRGRTDAVKVLKRTLCRVWDARLDACPTCSSADGTIVGVRESFSLGEPGGVHPFCRCSWTLVTLDVSQDAR